MTSGGKSPALSSSCAMGRRSRIHVGRTPDPLAGQRAEYLIGYVGTIGPQDGVGLLDYAIHGLVPSPAPDFLAMIIGNGDALSDVCSTLHGN